jgi:hypothetical protein
VVEASTIISCGTLAGAIIPELVKVFTSTNSHHVSEVVTSSREGGASLNILSGLVAGNFSAYWLGISIVFLMSIAYYFSTMGLEALMVAAPVFAFGLVAFGFLGMGPVTIAVDSYGPVTDNAQSVYELSLIRTSSRRRSGSQTRFQRQRQFRSRQTFVGRERRRRQHLQGDCQAGSDRYCRRRRHHHDLFDHDDADQRTYNQHSEPLVVARSVCARSDYGRRSDLLVHGVPPFRR